MTSAKIAALRGVDFDLLDDIEEGDVVKIHFTKEAIGDVAYLSGMISSGIITSPDEMVLFAIIASSDWGGNENRYVQISPTNKFDRKWFESRMAGHIDKLEVISRRRPLVSTSVLNQADANVRYRFKPDGLTGVVAMLELHDMENVQLNAADSLRSALEANEWGENSRAGHFINRLAGDDNTAYREHFLTHVLPHLELLRS